MKSLQFTFAKSLLTLCALSAFAVASANAVVVGWEFHPGTPDATVRSAMNTYQSGYHLTVPGDNAGSDALDQLGGFSGSAPDNQVVAISDFGTTLKSVSMTGASGQVLPVAFQTSVPRVPAKSVLFPIVGLVVAVSSTQILRRRRAAQMSTLNA